MAFFIEYIGLKIKNGYQIPKDPIAVFLSYVE